MPFKSAPVAPLRQVTLIQNKSTDPDNRFRDQVLNHLTPLGVGVFVIPVMTKDVPLIPSDMPTPDLVLVLGGDGTFLRAAECFVECNVPLAGINTGTLGFLTRIEPARMEEYFDLLIAGHYAIEERVMLAVSPHYKKDPRKTTHPRLALNDVVIKNANPSHLCTLHLFIDEYPVAVYDADGIIISTPTGSTAYTMAAGGPVISPEVQAIAITPICPHSFSAKAVVVPVDKTIRIQSYGRSKAVMIALDGQELEGAGGILKPEDSVEIFQASTPLKMAYFDTPEHNFYRVLRHKLDWAANPRWKENRV